MNLQELLSYRKCCMIHGDLSLKPYCAGSGLIFHINAEGMSLSFNLLDKKDAHLSIKTRLIIKYNFDGTYEVFDRDFMGAQVIVYMVCDECRKEKGFNYNNGIATLNEIDQNKYFYNFLLDYKYGEDLYECHLVGEVVRHTRNEKFYHLSKNHVTGETDCKMGRNDPKAILDDMLKGMLNLKLPHMDLTKIRDIDHLVDKIKLYNLFS